MLALDMARLEAGLILIEVDYTSRQARAHPEPELFAVRDRPRASGQPREVRRLRGPARPRARGRRWWAGAPARGASIDYQSIEKLYEAQDLPIAVSATTWREQRPVYAGERQVGRATSGSWSPTLKQHIALASVEPEFEEVGSALELERTVEGRRGRAAATVVPLPFFDPPRKRT